MPFYAEGIASQFASQKISNPLPHYVSISSHVLKFVDQEAVESNCEATSSDCSDEEMSVSASSSRTTSSDDSP